MKRVLVTGPVERRADWSNAARSVGWEPIEFALVAIVRRDVDIDDVCDAATRIDWICVTSSNSIAFVEAAIARRPALARTSFAVVGEASARRMTQIGVTLSIEPAASATELFEALRTRVERSTTILWPRGSLNDTLAHDLRALGCSVVDPIVYETRNLDGRTAPSCDVVFFASPSAVRAWHENAQENDQPRLAIAIGSTTLDALYAESSSQFERLQALSEPTPEALAHALEHLEPRR